VNANVARSLSAAGMLLAATAVGMIDGGSPERIMPPPGCGFYELSPPHGDLTARYIHCADSFILIKYHWSQGSTGTACIPPWDQHNFYMDGPHKIVNAYYVTTPPNLSGPPGNQMCSLSQPQV
jgi:hypothetical protein